MPFNQEDLYSSSAGTELYNYWNPFVTKFDSQSFYNFEQDNQPVYDLEERTKYLWEKSTGYATSSLYGMPLVVSGSLDSTNNNVFTDLQTAVDSLPDVIRTPTLIEVALSGNLGGLALKNIEIKDDGILEIINRGSAKIYSGQGHQVAVDASSQIKGGVSNEMRTVGIINQLSSLDLSSTIHNTSALSVATVVSGLWQQNKWHRTFVQGTNLTLPNRRRNDKLAVGFIASTAVSIAFQVAAATFNIASFERKPYGGSNYNIDDPTIGTADVSCVRGDNGAEWINRNNILSTFGDLGTGMTYANSLSSIEIENCNGPLYVRGFCVDGVSGGDATYENSPYKAAVGIDVNNSEVTLENCAVMRATTTGARFRNSHVDLSRGFFSYRNYQIESGVRNSRKTTGLEATNSTVNLKVDTTYASGIDYAFNIQAHDIGMQLQNSVLWGGQSRVNGTSTGEGTTVAFAYNKTGIEADNSKISILGNLDVYGNNVGMDLKKTLVKADRLTIENNNDAGILSDGSHIIYNQEFTRNLYSNDVSGFRMTQTLFHRNGTHLELKNGSKFSYDEDGPDFNYPNTFGPARFMDSMGVINTTDAIKYQLPSISLNNSQAKIIHPRVQCSGIAYGGRAVKGGAVYATNSSQVEFLGTSAGANMLIGPQNTNALRAAAAYADEGSQLSFMGPTVIAQFGYGAVGDNNSTLSFVPHRKDNFALNPSAFNLDQTSNHTSVEIHSQGNSCLVANNNSQIIMEDLGSPVNFTTNNGGSPDYSVKSTFVSGGSMQFYPNPENFVLTGDRVGCSTIVDVAEGSDVMSTSSHNNVSYNYYITNPFIPDASTLIRDSFSIGGLCVQSMGDSIVYANNVHFPMGHVQADGSYFDPSATVAGCNQLRIWNIADNSKLYASHLGVSASTPSSLAEPYHGPRSTFFSGTSLEGATGSVYDDSGLVAYGALASTPDTGRLSILDYFGLGVGINGTKFTGAPALSFEISSLNNARAGWATGNASGDSIYGNLTPQNLGPFRIFFSPKTEARFLSYLSGTVNSNRDDFATPDTRPLQHIAQGYSLSSSAGVPGPTYSTVEDASATTVALFQPSSMQLPGMGSGSGIDLSGYYYPSALLVSDRGTQVYLDESAANTFANAKNAASSPRSGKANPKISIYKSSTTDGGDGDGGDSGVPGFGAGLKSISIFDIRRNI
jgi:hypothetical protein